ncbi:Sfi1 spindle body protein-domain-containing protein [Lasiosphaeria hispida]|uniref:Sfi1 spindle body protein-domain-containing protein n=1 Tax=Lasiosphaeria hispida TaxID=260671 RepID=A0AAJ0HAK3_9PEZI|nr:Sfi1 spindle body protein-domain-containing protein [Lasiosphaeria hispida]
MPPQSSLPLRDGRVGLPSSSLAGHNDGDYSDEDINLLNEIVVLGEALYPTLPVRDRLPTNALFQAAEQVLPAHGYDPENAPSHISRLIFKIGGQRSGDTLSDKFRAVLAGMNIMLEFIPSSPIEQSPAARSMSNRSNGATDDETGDLDFGTRRIPRRRYSSVSRPERPSRPDNSEYDLPSRPQIRARSVSFTDYSVAARDVVQSSQQESAGDAQTPQRKLEIRRVTPMRGQVNRYHPVAKAGHISSKRYDAGEDDDGPGQTNHRAATRPAQLNIPIVERFRNLRHGFGNTLDVVGGVEPEKNKGLRESPLIIPNAHLIHHSPQSDDSGAFRGASDTTAQTQDDDFLLSPHEEPITEDTVVLEAKLHQVRMEYAEDMMQDAFSLWHAIARETKRDNKVLGSLAAEFDDVDMIAEVMDIWHETAVESRDEKLATAAAAEYDAYVAKMEKRACRVYQIFTIRNALIHWQDRAQDEVDRTAVARRHLVRKRAFDGWRAQHVEDESKVTNFILINALQIWTQINLHHDIRKRVALQSRNRYLAQSSLRTMWEEHKCHLADDFRYFRTLENCLGVWTTKTREALGEQEVAVTLDERLLLEEVVAIWHEESEDLQYTAYDGSVRVLMQECRRTLDHWQEQSRLERLLRLYNTAKSQSFKHQALQTWHSAFVRARRDNKRAIAHVLKKPFNRWLNDTKLLVFTDHAREQTKHDVLGHWFREERLAWYRRYTDKRTKRGVLDYLHLVVQQARAMGAWAQQEADNMFSFYTIDTWLEGTEAMWRHKQNASLVCLYHTANPCLELWQERRTQTVARSTYYRREAVIHANTCSVLGVLDSWPGMAARARRARLMDTLREFRRGHKVKLAFDCLDHWWTATSDSINSSRDAYALRAGYTEEDIRDYVGYWAETARRAQDIGEIAADAEVEVYLVQLQNHLHEARENMMDAVDYDAERTLASCTTRWEFQALQLDTQKRKITAVQDKNDTRLRQQTLDDWHQVAVPESVQLDPRFSTVSRRSMRHQQQYLARSTAAAFGQQQQHQPAAIPFRSIQQNPLQQQQQRPPPRLPPYPPQTPLPVSQLGINRDRGGGTARSVHFAPPPGSARGLGPMAEFDEDEDEDEMLLPGLEQSDPAFMSTPTRWTGSARPLGYRPTTTPSAVLPSPYERELRRGYGGTEYGGREFGDIREESAEG